MSMLRRISGFPEYRFDDDGSVWSLKRGQTRRLQPGTIKGGYKIVALWDRGKRSDFLVHRLILEAFVGPCPEGMEGIHLDHDPGNNAAANLKWGTHKENMSGSVKAGRTARGEKHPSARLTDDQAREMIEAYASGESPTVLGKRYGIASVNVYMAGTGRAWSHLDPSGELFRQVKQRRLQTTGFVVNARET